MSRIISLVTAVVYLIFVLFVMGAEPDFYLKFLIYILFFLALIWFPEETGNYTGFIGIAKPRITTQSPDYLVALWGGSYSYCP